MTEKVFWAEPYRTTLATHITTVDGADVTLAATIFYALSGGQESDAGSIGGHAVLRARKMGQEIIYTLHADHGLQAGDAVEVVIDPLRRYQLMRLHFAAELVLELVYARCPGVGKVGAHIAADKARIDFGWPENIAGLFPALLADAHALIDRDAAIESAFSDTALERRYWAVEGFARVPCGGTHLRRTREVGHISLRRRNVGKGKERIEIVLEQPDLPMPTMAPRAVT